MDKQDENLDFNREYYLDVPERANSTNRDEDAFLVSIISVSGDQGFIGHVAELERLEGLQAVKHLLENDCTEDVENLFKHGVSKAPEKALDVYGIIAEYDQKLAYDLMTESTVPNEGLRTKMKSIYYRDNKIVDEFEELNDRHREYDN